MDSVINSFSHMKEPFSQSDAQSSITEKPDETSVCVDMSSNTSNKTEDPESNPDFRTIRLISSIILLFLRKCWMVCTTGLFVTFVVYWCYGSVIALFLFLCGVCGLFYQVSDWLLYHPDEPPHSRLYVPMPSLLGMPYESLFIRTDDGVRLHAMLIKQERHIVSQVPTVMFLHGNAGNIGHRLAFIHGFYRIIRCNILLIEYRGYGHSEGYPTEEGLYLDAQAGLKYLLELPNIDKSKIVVFGRSLGGAVAIDLASRPEFGKHIFVLIVENTFTSIPDIAREIFKFFLIRWLPTWCYKNQFNSLKKITKVTSSTLLISGQADNLIPPDMMHKLITSCGSEIKRQQLFATGTHNDTWLCKGYYKSINLFLDDVIMYQQQSSQWPR